MFGTIPSEALVYTPLGYVVFQKPPALGSVIHRQD